MKKLDAATMEVIRYGMLQATDEMKVKLHKSSIDPLVYIARDFSCGVFNAKGDLIAQSLGLPHFLANLGRSITTTAEDIGGFKNFEDGDVYMTNDPYRVVLHLPDIDVLMPVFYRGKLIGFTASRAHWSDIGAAEPMMMRATEVFQEGVLYRSIRAYEKGKPIPSILRLIRGNTRMPEAIERNLRAQVAASLAGKERMLATIEKYGVETFTLVLDGILKHGEEIARRRIRSIPNGVYKAESHIDDDGIDLGKPLKVSVTVTVEDDSMTVDLKGSNKPVKGPMNSGSVQTITECRLGFAALMPVGFPINEGVFRPLNVVIPEDSMFDAKWPAATFLSYQAGDLAKDLISAALAPAIPNEVCAPNYGNAANISFWGYRENGEFYICTGCNAGGAGAKPFEDGEDAFIFGDLANIPVEVTEKMFPLKVERYQLRQNSEGPGKYRGGFGLVLDVRFLDKEGCLSSLIARYQVPTFGILGGGSPPSNWAWINPDSENSKDVCRATSVPLRQGDLVRLVTSGGGGYGDPLERDPELVRSDAMKGLITVRHAEEIYGVILEGPSLSVDKKRTKIMHEQLRKERG